VTERKTEFTNNFFFDNVIDILLTQKCTNIKAFKVEKNSFFDVVIMCNVTSNTQMVSSVKKLNLYFSYKNDSSISFNLVNLTLEL